MFVVRESAIGSWHLWEDSLHERRLTPMASKSSRHSAVCGQQSVFSTQHSAVESFRRRPQML